MQEAKWQLYNIQENREYMINWETVCGDQNKLCKTGARSTISCTLVQNVVMLYLKVTAFCILFGAQFVVRYMIAFY